MSLIRKCSRIIVGRGALCSLTKFGQTKSQTRWASGFNEKRNQKDSNNDSIKKSVFISQSTDVFTNLALEDWLYRNFDFTNHHILLLWRNDPCVVIGRHQNPWLECDVRHTEKHEIALVRRNSGGGTVYHDNGNLNLSFFTPKERYNRRYNLDIITRALYREWGLNAAVNERDDIVVEGRYKVSGTAAKLGKPNAYHHCTLLVASNKTLLSLVLQKKEVDIENTNATTSTRSPIKNLTEVNSNVRMDNLVNAIGWEYLRTKPLSLEDGGYDHIQKQKGFQLVNPSEDWFPGINKLRDDYSSWEWTYGKTPKFTVTRALDLPAQNGNLYRLNLSLEVQNGIIEEIRMSLPAGLASADFNQDANVITNLRGMRYDCDVMDNIIATIGCKSVSRSMSEDAKKSNMIATQ